MLQVLPDLDRGLLELIAELSRATRIFQQESVFCAGVTFSQFFILDQVAAGGGRLPLAELHSALEVEKSTTTRLVAPLVEQELISRQRSRRDSRAVELSLTPQGREVLKTVWQ